MDNKILYVFVIICILYICFYILEIYLNSINNDINENFVAKNTYNIDIVVARYNEDLRWTLEHPFNQYKYIVYNKGDNEDFEKKYVKKIIKLPNVGKCDHTYLNHIITNYDILSEITVFFPGSIDMRYKKKIAYRLLIEIDKRQKAVFISLNHNNIKYMYYNLKLDNYQTKNIHNRNKNSEIVLKKSNIRPYGLWFDNFFGNIQVNCVIYYGIFSIHRNDILQHPVSRYQSLIKDLSDHSNPEVGQSIERSWCAIFHPIRNTYVIKYNKI
jgi:hypothetical protein